MTGHINTWRIT